MDVYYNPHSKNPVQYGPHETEYLSPDAFMVLKYQPSLLGNVLQELVRVGRLEHFEIPRSKIQLGRDAQLYWPDWMVVEHAVFGHYIKLVRSRNFPYTASTENRTAENDLTAYFREKLPHCTPAFNGIRDYLMMGCFPRVSIKMWRRVLLPALEHMALAYKFNAYYALSPVPLTDSRYNLQLYFVWQKPGYVYQLRWTDVRDYFKMPTFLKRMTTSPENYIEYFAAV